MTSASADTTIRAQPAADLVAAWRARPTVMGILNVTPDSFSDGGRFNEVDGALARARAMASEGATILDVGGESTRPGAVPTPADEERRRVLPVIAALARELPVPISIDTQKASVARDAMAHGARIINDVWGLQGDPEMAAVAAETGAVVIAMHNRAEADPAADIVAEVARFFERTLAIADAAGIARDAIVLDPGFGFGKTYEQNFLLAARIDHLPDFGCPWLVGVSRKSFIGRLLDAPVGERVFGTIAFNLALLAKGAGILRVHDVKAHHDALLVIETLRAAREHDDV